MKQKLVLAAAVAAAATLVFLVVRSGPSTLTTDSTGGPARPAARKAARPLPTPPPPVADREKKGASITILVTHEDKSPVASATISAGKLRATTDKEGKAVLSGAVPGKTLVVRAEGPAVTDVPARKKVAVPKSGDVETTLVLRTGGAVTGTVYGEGGPLGSAYTVRLHHVSDRLINLLGGGGRSLVNYSGSGGRKKHFAAGTDVFEITGLPPGRYVASATASGHVAASSKPFKITKGAVTRGIRIELSQGGRISGVVVRARTGAPVKGAQVSLGRGNQGLVLGGGGHMWFAGSHRTKTDAQGQFMIDGVKPGAYTLHATAKHLCSGEVDKVTVKKGGEVTGLIVSLGEGGAITGTVYDESGRPMPHTTVLVQNVPEGNVLTFGNFGDRAKTNADGVYFVDHLDPGRYRVKLPSGSSGTFIVSFSSTSTAKKKNQQDDGKTVLVREGETSRLDLRSDARATILGRIHSPDGKPLRQRVELREVNPPKTGVLGRFGPSLFPNMSYSDAKGRFTFRNVEPGTYDVTAGGKTKRVSVGGGETQNLDFTIQFASVTGTVLDEMGQPVAKASVSLERLDRANGPRVFFTGSSRAMTDDKGHFKIDHVTAGSYRVRARKGGSDSRGTKIEVTAGQPVANVSVRMEKTAKVVFEVADADGQPVAGAFVSVRPEEGAPASGRTDGQGRVTIGILPGSATVSVFKRSASTKKSSHASEQIVVGRGDGQRVSVTLE